MPKRHRFTYAQARLFLGITNVGFWVCFAILGLSLGWAGQFFPTDPLTGRKLMIPLAIFLLGYASLQAPFDLLGGYILPLWYRQFYGDFSSFMTNWLRGVAVQMLVLFAISYTLLNYANWFAWIAVGWMILLLILQMPMAWLVGNFINRGENAWKSQDEAFTGGVAGFPGLQSAIFVTGRGQKIRAMDERRRRYLQQMSLPMAGVVIALTFNIIGILLISLVLHHSIATVAGLVQMSFWFTLWSFAGLLILPSLSRPAVFVADYALFAKGVTKEEFANYLEYDFSQSGEESRALWVERIFHPVPSPSNRLERWGQEPGWGGGWHAARYAIYLSWAGLSLVNRSVHCNIGKPNVWVMLPCD